MAARGHHLNELRQAAGLSSCEGFYQACMTWGWTIARGESMNRLLFVLWRALLVGEGVGQDRVTDSVTRVDGSVVDATTGQELSGVRVQISLSGAG